MYATLEYLVFIFQLSYDELAVKPLYIIILMPILGYKFNIVMKYDCRDFKIENSCL